MVLGTATSINGAKIRLTQERWIHITTSHLEFDPDDYKTILDVIGNPDIILKGDTGELLATKKQSRKRVWIVVAYKEVTKQDGFVLTAYFTSDLTWLFKKEIVWSKQ